MKNNVLRIALCLLTLFCFKPAIAEEIKYNFSNGAIYSYQYSIQSSSSANAPTLTPQKNSDKKTLDFNIKVVGFQNNAYILDIENESNTYRRYITSNGTLKGAPAEDRSLFPFFITFPEGDWRIGSSIKQNAEITTFGKPIPVIFNLTLNKIDSIKNLAEISFDTKYNISDDKFFSRTMNLNGHITFNMAEGVIHKAEWKSNYTAKQICKEKHISRDLWNFEKQTSHTLSMTGVEK